MRSTEAFVTQVKRCDLSLFCSNVCDPVARATMVTIAPLRMQNGFRTLPALLDEFCPAQDTIILFLEDMRKIAALRAKPIAVRVFVPVTHG